MRVCVVDKREIGWGSTAASTALLQYEIDTELQDLREMVGEANAVLAYTACRSAVLQLGQLASRMRAVNFRRMRSLYFASKSGHEQQLRNEGQLRQSHGLDVEVIEPARLKSEFGIEAPVGLLTATAAEVDPYQLAHVLLARVVKHGGSVHGRSELVEFKPVRGGVAAVLEDGQRIRCQHLIFAAGYESQTHLDQRVARNRSSYALVSEPMPDQLGALEDTLVWESARPYLYLRRTADSRVIAGGLDDSIDIAARRDLLVNAKADKLVKRIETLLPGIPLRKAFAWAGTFAETEDGLPFFGPHPQHGGRVHFAMAYGGNGITYSAIGAEILQSLLQGKTHPCAELFSFRRLAR